MTGDSKTRDGYKLRGKCHELSKKLCEDDPTLQLVRGWYHCPIWGKQQHWWCKKKVGTIVDPTAAQFPSEGMGEYEEYAGIVTCAECGKELREKDAIPMGPHFCCSERCAHRLVGI